MTSSEHTLLSDRFQGYFGANRWLLFAVLALGYVLDIVIRQYLIIDDEVFFATYGAQVAIEEIASLNQYREDYGWIAFPVPVLVMIARILFTAICLNIGAILSGIRVKFGDLVGVALAADLAFLVHNLLLTALMLTVAKPETLDQLNTFAPFSLLGLAKLFGMSKVQIYYIYPLQVLHLFEVLYWVFLAIGIQRLYRKSFGGSLRIVMGSYGVGLLLWIVTVVFLLVIFNLSKS